MSKIPLLTNNKETIIGISLGIGLLLMVFIQTAILVPVLIRVYAPVAKIQNKEPIDTQTVNEALKVLGQ